MGVDPAIIWAGVAWLAFVSGAVAFAYLPPYLPHRIRADALPVLFAIARGTPLQPWDADNADWLTFRGYAHRRDAIYVITRRGERLLAAHTADRPCYPCREAER